MVPSPQLTLALFKPDLSANRHVVHSLLAHYTHRDGVVQAKSSASFALVAHRKIQWRHHDAETFYQEHRGRFFYQRLCGYMSSGPFHALVLGGENAIADWRKLIGPTHVTR
jgi:nucleoside-diphosphate kinase